MRSRVPHRSTDSHTSPPTHLRADVYLRVSTDDQAKCGYDVAGQKEQCQTMAIVKNADTVA